MGDEWIASALLEENPDVDKIRRILSLADRIVADDPKLDPDNVRLIIENGLRSPGSGVTGCGSPTLRES
jgi:hypothetical protein